MIAGQTKQFDTFDNLEDRRELVILFEKLGDGLPEKHANEVRAKFLESLIPQSVSGLAETPLQANPEKCYPTGAFLLFIAIVGVLGVPIRQAAIQLDEAVRKRAWLVQYAPTLEYVINTSYG
jgi:hypothetical protein